MKPPNKKLFSGRWFIFHSRKRTKIEAQETASILRKSKYNVRIVIFSNLSGYYIYIRTSESQRKLKQEQRGYNPYHSH
jgi:hypothetical protein